MTKPFFPFILLGVLMVSVLCTGSVVGEDDVVGLSYKDDSRIVLGVMDGSICYQDIEWHLFCDYEAEYRIVLDDTELVKGIVDGVEIVNTSVVVSGVHTFKVSIGLGVREFKVILINQSAESWVVEDWKRSEETVSMSTMGYLFLVIKTHLVTMAFFAVPAPFVFAYVIKRKEKRFGR